MVVKMLYCDSMLGRVALTFGLGGILWSVFAVPVLAQSADETTQSLPQRAVVTNVRTSAVDGEVVTLYEVRFTQGPEKGSLIVIGDNETVPVIGVKTYRAGDRVLVNAIDHIDGSKKYLITDYDRRSGLLWLVIAFMVSVMWLSRWRGVRSLVGLAFSYAVIVLWIVPLIAQGYQPVTVSLVGATAILLISFFITEGFGRHTLAAATGTVGAMLIIGGLSIAAMNFTHLTGASSEEAFYLQTDPNPIDVRGLLLAGIIIGTIGMLDDIAISQVATVGELRRANPRMPRRQLYNAALRVGRSHLGAIVNTLLLAYTGSALPLLVLFSQGQNPAGFIINGEIVATEIVRAIVGSLGIILAVPITTALAVWFNVVSEHPAEEGHVHA